MLYLWAGPHCSLAIIFVIDLPGPWMVEQCVQNWNEMESFLRSGEYNALAVSQIKLVCFSEKEVEVFGFHSITPTPPPLRSIFYNGSLMMCVLFDLFDF